MYASWGVAFLKYDRCSLQEPMRKLVAEHNGETTAANELMVAACKKMGDGLRATGRLADAPWPGS